MAKLSANQKANCKRILKIGASRVEENGSMKMSTRRTEYENRNGLTRRPHGSDRKKWGGHDA